MRRENWQPSAHKKICSNHFEELIEEHINIYHLVKVQITRNLPTSLLTECGGRTEIHSGLVTGNKPSKVHNTYQTEQISISSVVYVCRIYFQL